MTPYEMIHLHLQIQRIADVLERLASGQRIGDAPIRDMIDHLKRGMTLPCGSAAPTPEAL